MPKGRLLFLLTCLVSACDSPAAEEPSDPLAVPGVTYEIMGTLKGPQGILSTTQPLNKLHHLTEEALVGQTVYLADAKLQPLEVTPARTDSKGAFAIASPHRAGFVMAKPASASAPLISYYKAGAPAYLSVASTMVAWKLWQDLATGSHHVTIVSLDPTKVEAATMLVAKELQIGALSPDYSLPSWPDALDFYTYKSQGELAKAFNALIPGSVAPRMSR